MKVCKDVIHNGRVTWINGLCDWWFSWFSWVACLCSLSGGLRIITWVWFYTVFEWMSLIGFIVWMYYLISWCVYVMVYFPCMMWWCIFCWQYVILMGCMLGVFCLAWKLLVEFNEKFRWMWCYVWFSMIVWIWGLCVQTKDALWS